MNISQEIYRKSIHFLSLSIPFGYSQLSKENTLSILIPISILIIGVDCARLFINPVRQLFDSIFKTVIRDHEERHLTGSSYVMISAVVTIWLFPKYHAIFGLLLLGISDTFAALVGKKYGNHQLFNKSIEGTLAFFISSMIITYYFSPIPFLYAMIASVGAATIEVIPVKLDDNFTIPLFTCTILWLVDFI